MPKTPLQDFFQNDRFANYVAISYLKAAVSGTLIAEAEEVALTAKLGTYAVRVVDEQGTPIALFQGTVYRKGQGGQQNGPILSDIVS